MTALGTRLAAATRAWPVTIIYATLLLAFVAPGLLSAQTLEGLESYGWGSSDAVQGWAKYAISTLVTLLLGSCLSWSSGQLLHPGLSNLERRLRSPRWHVIHALTPVVCLAIGLSRVAWSEGWSGAGYAVLAAMLAPSTLVYRKIEAGLGRLGAHNRLFAIVHRAATHGWPATLFLVLVIAFVVDRETCVLLARAFGPVALLLIFLLVFCGLSTALVRIGRATRVPILFALAALACLFGWYDFNDNHPVRRARGTVASKPVDVQASFRQWMASRPEKARFSEYPVILVSAEGGGIRAAFFTAVTLGRLIDRCPALANHIFAISGVSGGSVGAATFVAAMKAWPPDTSNQRCDIENPAPPRYEAALAQVLGDDHLSPLLARTLFPDALQRLLPFPVDGFDRQRGLEWSLEHSFERVFGQDLLTQPLYGFNPSAAAPAVPYLLLNATEVETGRRVVMTPLFLRTEEFGSVEDWRWFDWDYGPTLSAAATTSARFPFLSPAGYQHSQGRKARYVDGGYFDNSGIATLTELFKALYLQREQEFVTKDGSTRFSVIAIHIGNAQTCDLVAYRSNKARLSAEARATCDQEIAYAASSGVGEMASPLQTLINVRNAQVEYNLQRFHAEMDRGTDFNRFDSHNRIQMIDRGIPVPLGWLLSRRVAEELRFQLDPPTRPDNCKGLRNAGNSCQLKNIAGVQTWRD